MSGNTVPLYKILSTGERVLIGTATMGEDGYATMDIQDPETIKLLREPVKSVSFADDESHIIRGED